jgi:hypothetical protein
VRIDDRRAQLRGEGSKKSDDRTRTGPTDPETVLKQLSECRSID